MGVTIYVRKLNWDARLPTRANESGTMYDVYNLVDVYVPASEIRVVDTGIMLIVPDGYIVKIESLSDNAHISGIVILSEDSKLYGDDPQKVSIVVANLGRLGFKFKQGERLARVHVVKCEEFVMEETS